MTIILQRIYNDHAHKGYRVLVDRLWPRGISKDEANLDDWWKELAPSPELRKWFDHDPDKWGEFRNRYLHELGEKQPQAEDFLKDVRGELVLLFGAKDEQHSHALVLKDYLEQLLKAADSAVECASPPCYSRDFD